MTAHDAHDDNAEYAERTEHDRVVMAGVMAMDDALWSGDIATAIELCDQLTRYVELNVTIEEARAHGARERQRLLAGLNDTLSTAIKTMDERLWAGDVRNAERVYQHLLGYLDRHLHVAPQELLRWRREHGIDPYDLSSDLANETPPDPTANA